MVSTQTSLTCPWTDNLLPQSLLYNIITAKLTEAFEMTNMHAKLCHYEDNLRSIKNENNEIGYNFTSNFPERPQFNLFIPPAPSDPHVQNQGCFSPESYNPRKRKRLNSVLSTSPTRAVRATVGISTQPDPEMPIKCPNCHRNFKTQKTFTSHTKSNKRCTGVVLGTPLMNTCRELTYGSPEKDVFEHDVAIDFSGTSNKGQQSTLENKSPQTTAIKSTKLIAKARCRTRTPTCRYSPHSKKKDVKQYTDLMNNPNTKSLSKSGHLRSSVQSKLPRKSTPAASKAKSPPKTNMQCANTNRLPLEKIKDGKQTTRHTSDKKKKSTSSNNCVKASTQDVEKEKKLHSNNKDTTVYKTLSREELILRLRNCTSAEEITALPLPATFVIDCVKNRLVCSQCRQGSQSRHYGWQVRSYLRDSNSNDGTYSNRKRKPWNMMMYNVTQHLIGHLATNSKTCKVKLRTLASRSRQSC